MWSQLFSKAGLWVWSRSQITNAHQQGNSGREFWWRVPSWQLLLGGRINDASLNAACRFWNSIKTCNINTSRVLVHSVAFGLLTRNTCLLPDTVGVCLTLQPHNLTLKKYSRLFYRDAPICFSVKALFSPHLQNPIQSLPDCLISLIVSVLSWFAFSCCVGQYGDLLHPITKFKNILIKLWIEKYIVI